MPPSRSRRSSISSYDSSRSRSRSRSRSPPRSRSSSAGPHPRNARRSFHNNNNNNRPRLPKKKPSFKTTAVLIAAIAVATICIHRVWHKRKHPEVRGPHWDTLNAPGRHSRRRNVVRDRHNGYVPEYDRPPRRRLPSRRGLRYYEDESDGYFSDYNPPPRTYRLAEEPRGQRLTEEAIMGPPRDEIVRYAKTSARSEAESSKRFFDEDNRSRRVEDAVEDWSRRGAARFPSPERRRPETVYDDRRSRRRSDYY